jgi:hypothetical protein
MLPTRTSTSARWVWGNSDRLRDALAVPRSHRRVANDRRARPEPCTMGLWTTSKHVGHAAETAESPIPLEA